MRKLMVTLVVIRILLWYQRMRKIIVIRIAPQITTQEKLNSSSYKVVRIAHINVCSLRTKMNEIRVYRDNANSKFLVSQRRT